MPTVDLTHPLGPTTHPYPGDPPVALEPHATHEADGYRVAAVALGSHSGTHVDAPAHTEPDGRTLDEFPVGTFRFDAVRVDLTDVDARGAIRTADLPTADPPDADGLVLHTGWDEHWGTDRYRDHPYLAPEAAGWLADRGYHVGLDTFGPDPTPSANADPDEPDGVPAHRRLLGAERLLVENLQNLAATPARFTLRATPLALVDADGAPVRAVAEFDR